MAKYVMALDSGTTSNRCILFDESGRIRSVAQKEFMTPFIHVFRQSQTVIFI